MAKNNKQNQATTKSEMKGMDTMKNQPLFDLQAALGNGNSGVTWDPTSFITDYVHKLEDAKKSPKPVKYIMGADGHVYEMRSTELGDFIVKTNKVVGADNIQEGFSLNIPKIPFKLLLQAVSFFRDVCDKFNNDEAMLQFWYNKETNEFFAECLEQTTNKVHVTFLRKKELEENPNMVLVMDIHSHNTMNAFFSATDDASEQETRTYGVIGRLDKEIPEYRFRISVEGKFKEVSITELFEMPKMKFIADGFEKEIELTESQLFFPQVEYPKEWLDIVAEGKRSTAKFVGKGNPRRGTLSPMYRTGYSYPSLLDFEDDEYANASQLSLFNQKDFTSTPDYQQRALKNREGFGFEEDLSDQFIDESVDDPHADSFMQLLVEQMDAFEEPETRVEFVTNLLSNFSIFEIKMLVDRMVQIGYDHDIIEQLKQYGYKIQQ